MKTLGTSLLLTLIVSLNGCANSEPEPQTSFKLTYHATEDGDDDCAGEVCEPPAPYSMCHFAANLGTLAIVELLEDIELTEGIHCSGDRTLRKLRLRVVAIAAGEQLPDEITVLSEAGLNGLNEPGGFGLMQLRQLDGTYFKLRVVGVDLNEGPLSPNRNLDNDRARELPTDFEQIVAQATAIESGEVPCPEVPQLSDGQWLAAFKGDCGDD